MSKEQIEEMIKELCDYYGTKCGGCGCKPCAIIEHCKALYNAGYRKQSEGEWIDKPTGAYGRMQSWCSACGKHSGIGGIESNRHKPFCPNCGAKMKGGAE
jgi:hypothetical protein